MTDLLGSLVVLALLVVAVAAVLALLVVVPFVRGVDMAERRGFSTQRWGAVCAGLTGLGLLVAYGVHAADLSRLLYLPALVLTWGGPAVLALLGPGQSVGGLSGAHER